MSSHLRRNPSTRLWHRTKRLTDLRRASSSSPRRERPAKAKRFPPCLGTGRGFVCFRGSSVVPSETTGASRAQGGEMLDPQNSYPRHDLSGTGIDAAPLTPCFKHPNVCNIWQSQTGRVWILLLSSVNFLVSGCPCHVEERERERREDQRAARMKGTRVGSIDQSWLGTGEREKKRKTT